MLSFFNLCLVGRSERLEWMNIDVVRRSDAGRVGLALATERPSHTIYAFHSCPPLLMIIAILLALLAGQIVLARQSHLLGPLAGTGLFAGQHICSLLVANFK